MQNPAVDFGMVSIGYALGEQVQVKDCVAQYTNNTQKVLGYGYEAFHMAKPEQGLLYFSDLAARDAMQKVNVAPEELDLIVLSSSGLPDYLNWDASAALQRSLGAWKAETVFLEQACASGAAVFDIVAGKLLTNPQYQTVLVVCGNRVADPYANRMTTLTCVLADGAAAAVVRRNHPSCTWLVTDILTDGRYSDFFRYGWGGSARPFGPEVVAEGMIYEPLVEILEFFRGNPDDMMTFAKLLNERCALVMRRACERIGISAGDVRWMIYDNDNQKMLRQLAELSGIPLERTNARQAAQHGHLGAADQLHSLQELMEAGEIKPGDIVALIGMGNGMHWACTLVKV